MAFAIDKWKKNGWKIALWSALGLLAIKFAIWPLLQGAYDKVRSVGKKEISITEWLPDFGPYWLAAFAGVVVFLLLIWAGAKDGKTAGERMKKASEVAFAFAKLAALVGLIGVFFVFLVGPKYFWGDYYAPPPQTPSAQAARVQTTYPQPFAVMAQPGNPQNQSAPWSAPIAVNGRRFSADVQGADTAVPMAVLADGVVHIIAPGLRPHIGAPQEIRFLSLTNFPLQISGTIE